MTDDRRPDDAEDDVPAELEHSSAGADEARAVTEGGDEVEIDPELLEDEAVAARADLDDDGDVDEDDHAYAATRGRKDAAGRPLGGSGPRFIQFLRASWAELQRVHWPDRRQVGQATAVVLGFVIIAGAYLGFADWVAQQLVNFIL